MIQLRDYQIELAKKGCEVLKSLGIVYFAVECRVGKTLITLETARLYGAKSVCFITKKKAIHSVQRDYDAFNPEFAIEVSNKESLHKIKGTYDLIVLDEAHQYAAFPKPSKSTRLAKSLFEGLPIIFLSGTPSPESYSQLYHQFWVSKRSPFPHSTFYGWAKDYVNVTQRTLPHGTVNDYSDARLDDIAPIIEPYMIRFTQRDAGFVNTIEEEVLWVEPSSLIKRLIARLRADLVVQGKDHIISAATPVSLQSKMHQLYSGTILFDPVEGQPRTAITLDPFKANFIRDYFAGQKIVIFYKFQQERNAILETLGDAATDDIEEFRKTHKSIALQIVSGREGISLAEAEAIVFYNIDFSSLSYLQGKDRLTTMDRKYSKIYWVFSIGGIEEKIYAAVTAKKDYTVRIFKRDFGIKNPESIDKTVRGTRLLRDKANKYQQKRFA